MPSSEHETLPEASNAMTGKKIVVSGSYLAQLERELAEAQRRIAFLEVQEDLLRRTRDKYRYRYEVSNWKLRALEQRRFYRLMDAFVEASGSIKAFFLLPVRVWRIIRTPPDIPPRPVRQMRDEPPSGHENTAELIRVGREAYQREDLSRARDAADALAERALTSAEAFGFARAVFVKSGAVTDNWRLLHRRRRVADSPALEQAERRELGRLRELDSRWLPEVPGPQTKLSPTSTERVLHIIKESAPYLTNGYTMRSRYTFNSQRAAGLDPIVVTSLGFPRTLGESVPEKELIDHVPHYRLDLGEDYGYETMPWDQLAEDTLLAAAPIVERTRPALIQAGSGFRGFETALVGHALARHYGLPFIYEVRSFLEHTWTGDLHLSESGEQYELRVARENQMMELADHVITIAYSMRDDLHARGVPEEKLSVVPNGVDTDVFQPKPKPPSLARKLELGEATVLGYISNLGQREGIDLLIEATAQLRRNGENVVTLIVGDGPERESLVELATDLDVVDAVRFPGRVPHEEVNDYYALIDIFVIPRRDDRAARLVTPLKPFEAMSMARCLLVSDLPALTEVAAPGERGLAFAVEDANSLAEQASVLVRDPSLRERLGRSGREWVVKERDWRLNGPRYRDIYERLTR